MITKQLLNTLISGASGRTRDPKQSVKLNQPNPILEPEEAHCSTCDQVVKSLTPRAKSKDSKHLTTPPSPSAEDPSANPTPMNSNQQAADNQIGAGVGRGLDVGTANLLGVTANDDGSIVVKRERNAFLRIPSELVSNKNMLTKLNVPYVSYNNDLYVIGDAAFELANLFGKEVQRPMADGFLSPSEHDAIPMMRFIIERLLGAPKFPGERVCFCIPADSIDKENDTVYHEGIVSGLLRKQGFTPQSMNEAHAVVYSELGDKDFTGIGISCGGGMFNVCVSYRTIPVVAFSVARGGDWVDNKVARVLGVPVTRATAIKEGDINLSSPRNDSEEAVVLYYRNLVSYVLQNLKQRFIYAKDVPHFTEPVEIVVAGGTSMIGGFVELFAEEIAKIDFPFEIACVRRAEDPMSSVVRGCLIASALEVGSDDAQAA